MAGEYILVFDVAGTGITLRHRKYESTASSLRADKCLFYFENDWDDYGDKMALFGADRDRLKPVLLSADRDAEQNCFYYCYIPRDVLAQLSAGGNIYIAVQGEQATAGFTPAVTDALEQVSVLRTKFYNLNIADSGQIEFYITAQEAADFLAQVGAALSTMRSENNAAIALLEGKSIESVAINAAHELVITMQNGTVYNLGNVKGAKGDKGDKGDTGATGAQGPRGVGISNIIMTADGNLTIFTSDSSAYPVGHVKGDKGDKGDTGAQGIPGVAGADGKDGADGVSITGVTASLDAQNRRVFTFAFSDGTSQAVIVPGEVITVTDEQGQDPQAITVQEAVQSLANVSANLDERVSNNSTGISTLNANKADKTVVSGTDGKRYTLCFTMSAGKPAIEYEEVVTNE